MKSKEKITPAKDFAKEHWKEILATSATLAGAVIFLLIKYHKKRKEELGDPEIETDLDVIAADAQQSERNATSVLLDLSPVIHRYIPDAGDLAEQLAEGLPEEVKGKKTKLKWFKGSPKGTMQTVGRIKN